MIYIIGGCEYIDRQWILVNSVESYDLDSDTWSTVASMAESRACAGVATHDGLIYVIGGINEVDDELSSVEVYDTKCNVWSQLGSNMSTGKESFGAVVIDKPK